MTKYRQYFDKMLEENNKVFENFKTLHVNFSSDQGKYQDKFNSEGEKILAIAKAWEAKLCSQSEKAGFGNYTTGLAEKFQTELRNLFPLIDHVGVIVKPFSLKRIKLQS